MMRRVRRGRYKFMLPLALSIGILSPGPSHAQSLHGVSIPAGTVDGPQELLCEELVTQFPSIRELRDAVERQATHRVADVDAAILRARRAARAPEYVRFQAGGRYDRDSENRSRLVQDFDGNGLPTKAGTEDRLTHQDDMYLDVRIATEWRLSRTRWSDAEIQLRRERSQLQNTSQDTMSSLYTHWGALVLALRHACQHELGTLPPPAPPAATSRARSGAQSAREPRSNDPWLDVDLLILQIDDLSAGALHHRGLTASALRDALQRSIQRSIERSAMDRDDHELTD